MDQATHNKIVSFLWAIADDVLRDLFKRGKYPDTKGRTILIVDTHRGDGKRFVVRGDEKLTAFAELESAVRSRN